MTIAEPEVAYPAHLEADVVLRTGRTLRIRPVLRGAAPSNIPALREAILRLSALITICPESASWTSTR